MQFFKKRYLFSILIFAFLAHAGTGFFPSALLQAKVKAAVMFKLHAGTTQPLHEEVFMHAKEINNHLNTRYNKTLFNTKLLRNPKKTSAHLALPKKAAGHGAVDYTVTTSDGASIATTFIDHNSNTLLVIGSGFSYDRRALASFACYAPDIVLFQPRGNGIDHQPTTMKGRFSHKIMGVDATVCRLGAVEEHDVIAVTEYYKRQKNYKSVVYLGICYSAVIGAKACALRPDLFNKLILDGSWPSLKVLVERVIKTPRLLLNPQATSWPIPFITTNKLWTMSSIACTQKLFNFNVDQALNGSSFYPQIHKPILFFQGLEDCMVPVGDFEEVWDMIGSSQKVAVYTPSRHIQAHIKHKELYAMLCHIFINYDFTTFTRAIQNPEFLKTLQF